MWIFEINDGLIKISLADDHKQSYKLYLQKCTYLGQMEMLHRVFPHWTIR